MNSKLENDQFGFGEAPDTCMGGCGVLVGEGASYCNACEDLLPRGVYAKARAKAAQEWAHKIEGLSEDEVSKLLWGDDFDSIIIYRLEAGALHRHMSGRFAACWLGNHIEVSELPF